MHENGVIFKFWRERGTNENFLLRYFIALILHYHDITPMELARRAGLSTKNRPFMPTKKLK